MTDELFGSFRSAIDQYAEVEVAISHNEAAITNFYQLAVAVTIFVLIYVGLVLSGLELGELGSFVIAMFPRPACEYAQQSAVQPRRRALASRSDPRISRPA